MNRILDGDCRTVLITGGNGPGKTLFLINALVIPYLHPGGARLNPYVARWPFMQKKNKYIRYNGPNPDSHQIGMVMPTGAMETAFLPKLAQWAPWGSYSTTNLGTPQKRQVIFEGGGVMFIYSPKQDLSEQAGSDLDVVLGSEPFPPRMLGEMEGRLREKSYMLFENCPDFNRDAARLVQIVDMMAPETKIMYPIHKASACYEHEPNGFKRHKDLKKGIEKLQATNPESVPARVAGISSHYAGKLFQQWRDEIHVIPESEVIAKIQKQGAAFYCGIDPHDNKPFVVEWVAVTPDDEAYIVEEWPRWEMGCQPVSGADWFRNAMAPQNLPYHMIKVDYADSIERIIKVLHTVEAAMIEKFTGGFDGNGNPRFPLVNPEVVNHYIDPVPANTNRKIARGKSILVAMNKAGGDYNMTFRACKREGNLDWRHKTVRGLLADDIGFDEDEVKQGKIIKIKRLFVSSRCQNVAYAFKEIAYLPVMKYGAKADTDEGDAITTKIDETLKHWPDAWAYVMQRNPVYAVPKAILAQQRREKQQSRPKTGTSKYVIY